MSLHPEEAQYQREQAARAAKRKPPHPAPLADERAKLRKFLRDEVPDLRRWLLLQTETRGLEPALAAAYRAGRRTMVVELTGEGHEW